MKKIKRKNKTEIKSGKRASVGVGTGIRGFSSNTGRGSYVLGIDEVGRGPLAGPVTVCVSVLRVDGERDLKKELKRISGRAYPIGKDSKKMTKTEREFWFEYFEVFERLGDVHFFVGSKSAKEIDKKGIAVCIQELVDTLIARAVKKLNIDFRQVTLLADAGLKTKHPVGSQRSIIKGDEKKFAISIASVYAKVMRDAHMKRMAKRGDYEKYGFEVHKGYGTLSHRTAIRKFGLSDRHRKGFCKKFV
jgi:ribonuclease HII